MPKINAIYCGNTFLRGYYFFERVLLFREGTTFLKRVSNFQVGAYLFKRVNFYWVLLFRQDFFKRVKGTFFKKVLFFQVGVKRYWLILLDVGRQ